MSIQSPITRLDRLQKTLGDVFIDALGNDDVFWSMTEPSQASLPGSYVVLDLIVPPSPIVRRNARETLLNPTTSIDVTVTTATTGAMYTLKINGSLYQTVGLGGDAVTDIAGRLVDAVNGDLVEPVTAAEISPGVVQLTSDFDGALWELVLGGLMSFSNQVISANSVTLTEGDQGMVVNVQAFSKNQQIWNGAGSITNVCYAALQSPDYSATLQGAGIGIGIIGVPTSVPLVEGARWESRSSFDVDLTMKATWVRPAGRIESVDLTTTLQPGDIVVQQTITAP
jgi:hypothetical protein